LPAVLSGTNSEEKKFTSTHTSVTNVQNIEKQLAVAQKYKSKASDQFNVAQR